MIEGLLAGLLLASLILNAVVLRTRAGERTGWRTLLAASEDMRRAAELRSNAQIDTMLERLHTSPELSLDAGRPMVPARSEEPIFIPDTPDADEQWNEYRGEPGDAE